MARASVDTSQVDALARDLARAAGRVPGRVNQVLRKVSFDTEREVKRAMPVLSGRARASWGRWSSSDLVGSTPDAGAADAYWQETPAAVEQGTNLDYVEDLNAGSSRKAPAGFIDAAFERGERALGAAIEAVLAQSAFGR